jgi:hypothetical protein
MDELHPSHDDFFEMRRTVEAVWRGYLATMVERLLSLVKVGLPRGRR